MKIKISFNNLLKKLKELTADNNHTASQILIAKYYGLEGYVEEFKKIEDIAEKNDGLSLDDVAERYGLSLKMLDEIKKTQGIEVVKKLNSCL